MKEATILFKKLLSQAEGHNKKINGFTLKKAGRDDRKWMAGFHGILPNMNMLHRLIVRFLKNEADNRKSTWGEKAPGVKEWNPPVKL